ncbi:hypothetical protein [Methanobrevibacter sp.]|uniref:hypothetical protein n=1 Tax=Methanobrevibacter sp. TaxID=66852 RepID=UPI0025E93935|nr:hypothetical protein [Methanobrevibacter sp.]MBQ2832027.1 hypothetical protein [Methanobrevibacter sp.]
MARKKASLHKKDNNKRKSGSDYIALVLRVIFVILKVLLDIIIFISRYIANKILEILDEDNKKESNIQIGNFRISMKSILIIAIILLAVFLIALAIPNSDTSDNQTAAQTIQLGNNSIGYVEKEGPYGNTSSPIKIAYLVGVHPRESGAHSLMLDAFNQKQENLSYCYYIYKVNVTSDSSDFSQSRMNGQLLAQEFAVPDMINESFNLVVDCHYSNGAWGVSRFVFTPVENNTQSYSIAQDMGDNFDWLKYYLPPNPSSPEYVTTPLNEGGVPAIIYEAYTEDDNNDTLEHDIQLIEFIDNWNFK